MSCEAFVTDVWFGSPDYDKPMTIEQAREDLDRFHWYAWKVPEGLTPERYMELWNKLVEG